MSYRNVEPDEVIHWMMHQHQIGASGWKCRCQSSARQAYGVPAFAASATAAFERIPKHLRHKGDDPAEAPPGAILYYHGGKYGHAAIAGKRSHVAWSTDYQKTGHIGLAPRTFDRWNLEFVGFALGTPFNQLVRPHQVGVHRHD